MAATPVTIESRKIAQRFREFHLREGSVQFLHMLIYEDTQTLALLRAETAAIAGVDPDLVQGVANAEWAAGNCGEVGGHTGMWYRAAQGAAEIDAACDAIEAAPLSDAEPEQRPN